ncbi:MAG TPA: SET domain-containing protein [Terriglobales bacterium]|nr:SET domain-containing protein [Terriglobales bacterium]
MSAVPLYKAPSKIHGYGAFASRKIARWETIAVWDGPYTDKLPNDDSGKYYMRVPSGKWLVGFGGDYAESFINHSKTPNTYVEWNDDIASLITLRDIEPNEEVTFDYDLLLESFIVLGYER